MDNSMNLLSPSPSHKLHDSWTMWAHLPHDIKWTLDSYIKICSFTSVEEAILLFECIPPEMNTNCMLFIMRTGIKPMWEDENNRSGGCFSYKTPNKNVCAAWKRLSYNLVGESLTDMSNKTRPIINGITISPKKNFCIIKIWMANCQFQNPDIIVENPNISKIGCLFKTHLS